MCVYERVNERVNVSFEMNDAGVRTCAWTRWAFPIDAGEAPPPAGGLRVKHTRRCEDEPPMDSSGGRCCGVTVSGSDTNTCSLIHDSIK